MEPYEQGARRIDPKLYRRHHARPLTSIRNYGARSRRGRSSTYRNWVRGSTVVGRYASAVSGVASGLAMSSPAHVQSSINGRLHVCLPTPMGLKCLRLMSTSAGILSASTQPPSSRWSSTLFRLVLSPPPCARQLSPPLSLRLSTSSTARSVSTVTPNRVAT